MSKDSQTPQPQSEEVDLGQLFKIIGNAFDRFFKFIGSIFIGIYKVVLLLFVHIYQRFVWYAGVVVLGVVIGFFIDNSSDKLYGANMYIETNFNSARQVYENLKQFHQLAYEDKDTLELAKRFDISIKDASKLKGFYIEPDLDENNIAKMYSDFYGQLDSISRLEMTYIRFKESLTPYNYSIHRIGVASTDKYIYKKIEKTFTEQLSGNPYLQELVEVNKLNLNQKDKVLVTQLEKTDSLVAEYLKIRISESKKQQIPNSGTNLYMGNAESTNLIVDESKIIEKRLGLENERMQINKALVEEKNVVNVLAGFPKSGYDISEWTDKKKFVLPIVLFIATLLVFSIIGFGKFLKSQSKILN
ncbi:hypothetical protein [Siansivirga zeaxanthinifaciens]|uniref:Uncharacterized protein n=1 Tax=Siansivirga zeaxanthinifaciens CC-SAMT-1 TaxID=1454006 RepID=A0A0C5WEZ5_9FLAO|nr:hypothetical protein [Siansivirga zeaxanthinifaciens]AJR04767.1 hypothetical protein AW14_03720 [Siansivirga zeaxanthinifaciens CC-SAMT-1]